MLKFLLVVIVFAAVTYVVVRMLQERGLNPSQSRQVRKKRPRPTRPPKMVAPDDDEDFLRDLDRKRLNPEDPEG